MALRRRDDPLRSGGAGPGCLAVLLLLAAAGAALYFLGPRWLGDADRRFLPWLESKGRALVGRLSLEPLRCVIEQSELDATEQRDALKFLEEKWQLAADSRDQKLSRERLINLSRDVVGSRAGLCYALQAVSRGHYQQASLSPQQLDLGRRLAKETAARLADGAYAPEELQPRLSDLCSVISGWRTETTGPDGRPEQDHSLRDLFRDLNRLQQTTAHAGDGRVHNLAAELRAEWASFKQKVQQAERAAAG